MAKVEWADAIKTVSGALKKINTKSQHAQDQKMVLATHRKAATSTGVCSRLFLRGLSDITRTKPLSAKEIAARERFSDVSAMVKARKSDLQNITTDQENFAAQVNTAGGCKTMRQYLWKVCGDIWDAQHA